MKIRCKVLLLCAMAFAPVAGASGPQCHDQYTYALDGTLVQDVFDVSQLRVAQSAGENLEKDGFGGPIEFCSNHDYFCLKGRIAIAVPKGEILPRWTYGGIECSAIPVADRQGPWDAVCEFRGFDTRFRYSRGQGVLSYEIGARPGEVYRSTRWDALFFDQRCFPE